MSHRHHHSHGFRSAAFQRAHHNQGLRRHGTPQLNPSVCIMGILITRWETRKFP